MAIGRQEGMDDKLECKAMTASFLLGMAMSALYNAQQHLIQGENKEGLSVVNEAIRELDEKVGKHVYGQKKGATANESQ